MLQGTVGEESEAHCYVHGKPCKIFDDRAAGSWQEPNVLSIHIAGPACVDFSRRKRKKRMVAGSISRPLAVWIEQFKASNKGLGIHEGVEGTPEDMLDTLLRADLFHIPQDKWKIVVFKLSPDEFGHPARRKRRYTLIYDSTKFEFTGSAEDLQRLFKEPSSGRTAEVFFADSAVQYEPNETSEKLADVRDAYKFKRSQMLATDKVFDSIAAIRHRMRHGVRSWR